MTNVDIDLIGVPVFVIDVEPDGVFRVAGINRVDAATVGVDAAAVRGRRVDECVPPDLATHIVERYSACVAARTLIEYDERIGDDVPARWWRTTLTPVINPASGRVVRLVGVAIEITERKHAEAELARTVDLDPLTGVLNRRGLERGIADAMTKCRGSDGTIGFVIVDLDDFKAINDAYGHPTGDAVLRHVAQILQMSTSDGEAVARIGGDEFALVLNVASREDLDRRIDIIGRLFDRDLQMDGRDLSIGASLGRALWHQPSTLDDLLAAADADMYRHKTVRRSAA